MDAFFDEDHLCNSAGAISRDVKRVSCITTSNMKLDYVLDAQMVEAHGLRHGLLPDSRWDVVVLLLNPTAWR